MKQIIFEKLCETINNNRWLNSNNRHVDGRAKNVIEKRTRSVTLFFVNSNISEIVLELPFLRLLCVKFS